jgi:hypothetical protein
MKSFHYQHDDWTCYDELNIKKVIYESDTNITSVHLLNLSLGLGRETDRLKPGSAIYGDRHATFPIQDAYNQCENCN